MRKTLFFFFLKYKILQGEKAHDMLADYHEDQVDNPNDSKAEYQAYDSRYDFALGEASDPTANPSSNGYYGKNNAYDIRQTEVITFFSHVLYLLTYC